MKLGRLRPLFWLTSAATLAFAISWAELSVAQKPYPVVTEIKDGVKTIVNPDFPRDGRWKAKLVEEMSCGTESAPEPALMNRPLAMKVDGQGRIFVMDWGDVHIKVYDGAGRFLNIIGRVGQGPGELGTPFYFDLLSGDRICILDGRQNRVSILNVEGQYLSGFPLKGFHKDIAIDREDRIFLGKWGAVKESDKLSSEFQEIPYVTTVFCTDLKGQEPVHIRDFLGESVRMKGVDGGTVGMIGGGGVVVWRLDPLGRIIGGCNADYRLSVYDADGRAEFAFGRIYEPLKNPRFKGLAGQSKNLTAFSRTIVFDEAGQVWIELPKEDDAKDYFYDVFSPDGIYLKQVRIATRISQFMKGKLYSLIRSDDEEPAVKRFAMELVPSK